MKAGGRRSARVYGLAKSASRPRRAQCRKSAAMSATERMIRIYDRTMPGSNQRRYYEDSGYFNFGYWAAGAKSQREASDALVDQLTARIAGKTGRILDVACGLGASTRRLARSYA